MRVRREAAERVRGEEMKRLNALLDWVERLFVFGAAIALLLMMLLTTSDLLSRKFLDYSFPSLYEFTEDYLMVALVFLTVGYVYTQGGHVRVTLFERLLPGRIAALWERVHRSMALALFLVITVKGWDAAVRAYAFNEMSNSALPYPLAPSLMLVPLGSGLLCIRILQSLLGRRRQGDPQGAAHGD